MIDKAEQLTWLPAVSAPAAELDPLTFDRVIVLFSGGKDSLACALHVLECGVAKDRIELWHQRIDGAPSDSGYMDWPCTDRYVALVAELLDLALAWQYREGGFRRELYRQEAVPAPITFHRQGRTQTIAPVRARPNTRRKFPAATADLMRRWCSAYLKIDVAARAMTNDPTLNGTLERPLRILVVSGERREESAARAKYHAVQPYRSASRTRDAVQWRPVLDWPEAEIWGIIRRWEIRPHPAYLLGWNRTSCLGCIFSTPDLWAMMRVVAPERFHQLEASEQELGFTIDRTDALATKANRGTTDRLPSGMDYAQAQRWAMSPDALALSDLHWPWPDAWHPPGAFHGVHGGSW